MSDPMVGVGQRPHRDDRTVPDTFDAFSESSRLGAFHRNGARDPPVVVLKNSHHKKIFSATQTVLRGQILARCTSDHGGNQVVFHSLFLKGMSVFERVVRRPAKVRDWVLTFLLGHTIFPGGRRRRLWSGQGKRNIVSGLGKLRFTVFFHGASIAVFF